MKIKMRLRRGAESNLLCAEGRWAGDVERSPCRLPVRQPSVGPRLAAESAVSIGAVLWCCSSCCTRPSGTGGFVHACGSSFLVKGWGRLSSVRVNTDLVIRKALFPSCLWHFKVVYRRVKHTVWLHSLSLTKIRRVGYLSLRSFSALNRYSRCWRRAQLFGP